MPDRDRREKASDIFNKSTPVFGGKVSFEEAFPQIEDLTVTVKESGPGVSYSSSRTMTYTKEYFPGEYIDCSNPLCYNGGFSIGSILHEMVREHQTDLETSRLCRGYEGSPKGRRKYRDCVEFFQIKVHIKYKDPA